MSCSRLSQSLICNNLGSQTRMNKKAKFLIIEKEWEERSGELLFDGKPMSEATVFLVVPIHSKLASGCTFIPPIKKTAHFSSVNHNDH